MDTEQQAKKLLVMTCPRSINGEFIARELAQEQSIENLRKFSDRLAEAYERMEKQ